MDSFYLTTGRFDATADGYSMGVTILVLLTRMPAIDAERGHIVDRCDGEEEDLMALTDAAAGWPALGAHELFQVASALVKRKREKRITVTEARERLQTLADQHLPDGLQVDSPRVRECAVCVSAPRQIRFGCGHSVICRQCLPRFLERPLACCPHCRKAVNEETLTDSDEVARETTFVHPLESAGNRLGLGNDGAL